MLVFVPQGFVALVFQDGKPHAVLEPGVGVVERFGELQVQFVLLPLPAHQVVPELEEGEVELESF